jgi:hypothetical protein
MSDVWKIQNEISQFLNDINHGSRSKLLTKFTQKCNLQMDEKIFTNPKEALDEIFMDNCFYFNSNDIYNTISSGIIQHHGHIKTFESIHGELLSVHFVDDILELNESSEWKFKSRIFKTIFKNVREFDRTLL